MASEVAVLMNPHAGRGRHAGSLSDALRVLEAAGTLRVLRPDTREAALEQCRQAVADGARALVGAGGDGTVHLAVQAVAGKGVPLGVLPAGTGNDFAVRLGLPSQLPQAAQLIVDALAAGRSRSVDLGKITPSSGIPTWFCGVLAAGFDAVVNERGNRMRWPKGPRRYDLAILLELMRLRPFAYRVVLDGMETELDAVVMAVGNIASYGGGMRVCPDADPTDGVLDVVWAEPISRRTLMRLKPKIYDGTHVLHPAVRSVRVRQLRLDSPGIIAYADGERIAPLPIDIVCVPGALTLLS